jgi:hypothetical protein
MRNKQPKGEQCEGCIVLISAKQYGIQFTPRGIFLMQIICNYLGKDNSLLLILGDILPHPRDF